MSYILEGVLHKKYETSNHSETFQSRDFVIKTDGQYPQHIKLQLTQDRCDIIEPFEVGAQLKVSFDLRGREHQDKYFTNLNAWKVQKGK